MAIKKNSPIPDSDHILRHVSWANLRKDENDNIIGILGDAFKPKPKDYKTGLSATWLEYFPGDLATQTKAAACAIRASFEVKPKSGFARGKVADIRDACLRCRAKNKIRVIYAPTSKNNAHVAVMSLPQDDSELFDLLAQESWADLILNREIAVCE